VRPELSTAVVSPSLSAEETARDVLAEHRLDCPGSFAIPASAGLGPQLSFHHLLGPVVVGNPPTRWPLLGQLLASVPVLRRGNVELGLFILEAGVILAPVARVGDGVLRPLVVGFLTPVEHRLELLCVVGVGGDLLGDDHLG